MTQNTPTIYQRLEKLEGELQKLTNTVYACLLYTSKLHFGMGLYITNSIMEQHNGQLILENTKETGGAKVTMKLPC